MREPQATSTLGPHRGSAGAHCVALLRFVLLVTVLLVTTGATAGAQIRGRAVEQPGQGYWLSGGASAASITDITDGATGTRWKFSTDPLWQVRGSLEKALDEVTTIGVAVAYGKADLVATAIVPPDRSDPLSNPAPRLAPAPCDTGCAAQTELWSLLAQFRSGGGPGFHTLFEASGGVTSFRNMRTRDGGLAIGKPAGTIDLTGMLGAGFAYTLSSGMVVALVQDFGIGFHSKADLPSGASRTWRVRNTRASLRFHF